MKKRLKRCESLLWLLTRTVLYVLMLVIFMSCMAQNTHSLRALSRSLGITLTTFIVVGLLFLNVYGKYDVGRRKSKPIIYSLVLAVAFTDVITYLQLMIMRVNTPSIYDFRLENLGLLGLAFLLQVLVIIVFVYGGNHVFFKIHPPERCLVITSSQKNLDKIVAVIESYQRQYHIDCILDYRSSRLFQQIAKSDTVFLFGVPSIERSAIIRYCYSKKKNIYFNPEIEDVVEMNSIYYILDDVPLLNANVKSLTMEQRIIKRLMDLGLAVFLGILSCPFWIGAAIAIKLHDGGKILFKQKRATIGGRTFEVYKFRTMKENVENRSASVGDDRITKPGHFLRKTRIDELPQLINIIKGDMTFVGPRPEMLENVNSYTKHLPEFKYRLRMKAGLTGYAQIFGKYNTSPKDKLIMDMMYIEKFSILKDIQLMFQTVIVLLKKDSTEAFSGKKESKYTFVPAEDEE